MKYVVFCIVLFQLVACSGSKKIVNSGEENTPSIEQRQLDTMVVSAPKLDTLKEELPVAQADEVPNELEVYRATYERTIDILHTTLNVSFDWEREAVLGKAEIKLKPLFYATNKIVLDAKGFEIHDIKVEDGQIGMEYTYDGQQLTVILDKVLTRQDKITIAIDYTAFPGETGGSAAITSDKGLFFINADGSENKPQQIWTQGETEHNSKWFPTVDKPNERTTSDIYITVKDKFKTLSNGLLLSSKDAGKGMRTDHWKMDQPHAPYLFMLAVGDFAVVREDWNGISLGYWVEPEFEKDAKAIFDNTPEMLSYFSDLVGISFPWQKYDQIVVRDYVSGAMENTTAVIFGEFVQRRSRDLIDNNNDRIVAHELFHHWFGDLVTTESWSNLTLNEGFANYSEHLWRAHKYGKYEGQAQLFEEKFGYIYSTSTEIHPLIDFQYEVDEDMFDAHTYNKGGMVLHMLRHHLGDDAFFAGLNAYLTQHAYSAVEVHDLRLAFEKVSGQDLNWFFNQWYLGAGHPELEIEYSYNVSNQSLEVNVSQTQDPATSVAIFQIPAVFDVYSPDGSKKRYEFWLNQRNQTFTISDIASEPAVVNFDPDHVQLVVVNQNFSGEQASFLINHTDHVADVMLNARNADPMAIDVDRLLSHPSKDLKLMALDIVSPMSPVSQKEKVMEMAMSDKNSFVKAKAIGVLSTIGTPMSEVKLMAMVQSTSLPYRVVDAALKALYESDEEKAIEVLHTINIEESPTLVASAGNILSHSKDAANLPFFEKNAHKITGETALDFYGGYMRLMSGIEYGSVEPKWNKLIENISASSDLYTKYGAIKGIGDVLSSGDELKVESAVLKNYASKIISTVDNPQYKAYFQSLVR